MNKEDLRAVFEYIGDCFRRKADPFANMATKFRLSREDYDEVFDSLTDLVDNYVYEELTE